MCFAAATSCPFVRQSFLFSFLLPSFTLAFCFPYGCSRHCRAMHCCDMHFCTMPRDVVATTGAWIGQSIRLCIQGFNHAQSGQGSSRTRPDLACVCVCCFLDLRRGCLCELFLTCHACLSFKGRFWPPDTHASHPTELKHRPHVVVCRDFASSLKMYEVCGSSPDVVQIVAGFREGMELIHLLGGTIS